MKNNLGNVKCDTFTYMFLILCFCYRHASMRLIFHTFFIYFLTNRFLRSFTSQMFKKRQVPGSMNSLVMSGIILHNINKEIVCISAILAFRHTELTQAEEDKMFQQAATCMRSLVGLSRKQSQCCAPGPQQWSPAPLSVCWMLCAASQHLVLLP